jgi:hypothetical protein
VVPARAVHVVRHRCCTELCKEPKSVRQPSSFFKKNVKRAVMDTIC